MNADSGSLQLPFWVKTSATEGYVYNCLKYEQFGKAFRRISISFLPDRNGWLSRACDPTTVGQAITSAGPAYSEVVLCDAAFCLGQFSSATRFPGLAADQPRLAMRVA
jgi:hypothetical protein